MVTIKNLFGQLTSFSNLLAACEKAARGKKYHDNVAGFILNKEAELLKLQAELRAGTYRPGSYRTFYLREYDKEREISAAPFRDRVVHHAFCEVVEPLFDQQFIFHSYACRKDKGTHRALKMCRQYARQSRYVLQADIVKYFANINHGVLLGILDRRIKDCRTMQLAKLIVHSWQPADGRGVPIGNLTSQFFANLYLNELDYFVKFSLRWKRYLRYMDDFLIFGDDKAELWQVYDRVDDFIVHNLHLSLHQRKTFIYPCANGVPWLGFRVFKRYCRIKPSNITRFTRRIRQLQSDKASFTEIAGAVRRWINHARYGDTYCLRKRLFLKIGEME